MLSFCLTSLRKCASFISTFVSFSFIFSARTRGQIHMSLLPVLCVRWPNGLYACTHNYLRENNYGAARVIWYCPPLGCMHAHATAWEKLIILLLVLCGIVLLGYMHVHAGSRDNIIIQQLWLCSIEPVTFSRVYAAAWGQVSIPKYQKYLATFHSAMFILDIIPETEFKTIYYEIVSHLTYLR